jgi:hypothetical protein
MAINYTALLGLAQPVTGTESNVWGDAVNDQITALLDSAIAGAATISMTAANVTLTDVDGSADQARMAILILTGTPGTTRNVVAPSRSKTYIVINQSDASAVIKGSATTGVTVRSGQAATCVWNGTDFEIVASGDVDGPASATNNAIPTFDGTTGKLIKDNSGATISAGVITATGFSGPLNGSVGATTPSTVVATQVDITAQGDLRLQDTTGGQYVALQAPGTIATSYTLTLPVDDGTSGQALITDGSGVLSWSTAASGDVYGPASATDNAVARYDGTTGKIIQNSAVTIADDGATVIAANSSSDGLRITQIGAGNALVVEDSANPDATPVVIDASGRLIIGNTTAAASPIGYSFQALGSGSVGGAFARYSANSASAVLAFAKSRNTTVGTPGAVVSSGDDIFEITGYADDGTNFIQSVSILAEVDGTPGTNDMPGRLVFSTTADGASSPTERMRIASTGIISLGAAPGAESLRVTPVASAVNFWNLTGNTAGNAIGAAATGGDTNISLGFTTKGNGVSDFYSNNFGSLQFRVTHTASAVNYLQVTGGATGSGAALSAQGSDTNISISLTSKGTGSVFPRSAGTTPFYVENPSFGAAFAVTQPGGATANANYLQVSATAAAGTPAVSVVGSDTNIDLALTPKGDGYVVVDSAYSPNLTLTDAATVAWNTGTAGGQVATFTFVSTNRTVGAPTNLKNGGFYALAVIQNAGSNTLTWNAVFKWAGGTAPTLSTAAGAKDYFVFRSDGTNLYQQGISQAVA